MTINRIEKHLPATVLDVTDQPWHKNPWRERSRAEHSRPEWVGRVEQFLGEHPAAALAVAVSVGLALGWLGKRK